MIDAEQLAVQAGPFRLEGISFSVPAGAYAALMGRTGSGKTTLLEAVCGLRPVRAGCLRLNGHDVTRWPPSQRGIGFVPQEAALFQHLTVRQHLEFAPVVRRWPRARIDRRVNELAAWLRLEPLLERRPHGLSGGEAQRVALGRALAAEPNVLCLDEPLSALDDDTRDEICTVLEELRRRYPVTVLHITHNRREAARLADLVLVLEHGRIAPHVPTRS